MRYILLFWAVPMGLFWAWFGLSYYDMNFGWLILSRLVHDFAFQFYGDILGIDPATIPPLVARACVVDTFIIFGILAFRRRADIRAWWDARRAGAEPALSLGPAPATGRAPPAE
jgi:hypothetical protein